jgi:hypothetical protein
MRNGQIVNRGGFGSTVERAAPLGVGSVIVIHICRGAFNPTETEYDHDLVACEPRRLHNINAFPAEVTLTQCANVSHVTERL